MTNTADTVDTGAKVLELKDRRGMLLVSLFAPYSTECGINAPSMYVHTRIRAGTLGRHGRERYKLTALTKGLKRPTAGIFFERT